MTQSKLFVVTGVSGNTGAAVATALLAGKHAVRVVVRDAAKGAAWTARGAEVAVADVADRSAFAAALRGATGAYLLLPPPAWTATGIAADRARTIAAIAGAVADAKPPSIVALSSTGAQHASGTGRIADLHAFESALVATGVPTTFLRAGFFMENWGSQIAGAVATGTLYYGASTTAPVPQVAAADIGKTAARLLLEGAHVTGTRVVQLAGPTDASTADVVAILGRLAGKPIAAVEVPPAGVAQALLGMGASQEVADGMAGIYAGLTAGLLTWTSPDVIRGTITLEQRLRELLAASRAA